MTSSKLSHKEALFRMGVHASGYEKATTGCPNNVTSILIDDKIRGGRCISREDR